MIDFKKYSYPMQTIFQNYSCINLLPKTIATNLYIENEVCFFQGSFAAV